MPKGEGPWLDVPGFDITILDPPDAFRLRRYRLGDEEGIGVAEQWCGFNKASVRIDEGPNPAAVVGLESEPLIGYDHTEAQKSRGAAFAQEDCVASLDS